MKHYREIPRPLGERVRVRGMLLVFLLFIAFVPGAYAELDLDQEVMVIPDQHNEKPYIWHVARNPKGYDLSIEPVSPDSNISEYRLLLNAAVPGGIGEIHLFITDRDLHIFKHLRPASAGGGVYKFSYNAPKTGKYRFEVVFKTEKGWTNLRKDLKIKKSDTPDPAKQAGEEDYHVSVKFLPEKIYAEHVGTLLFDISYKDKPLEGLEKIDSADMQVAAWDEDLKEFLFLTPKQNLGGPKVPVSIVFMEPGKHAVFAEFKHKGVIRTIELVVNAFEEPRNYRNSILDISPSE